MYKVKLFFYFLLLLPVCAFAKASNKSLSDQMLADLDVVKNTFAVMYAPADWKKEYIGWDLDEKIEDAKYEVLSQEKITVKEYQKILKKFFLSAHDYHVSVHFFSTEFAALPFRIEGVDGHYFIVWVDSQYTKQNGVIFNVGDEVLTINDQPIQEVVDGLMEETFSGRCSPTDEKLVAQYVTLRSATLGHKVPKGIVRVRVKGKGGLVREHQLPWEYSPEKINSAQKMDVKRSGTKKSTKFQDLEFFKRSMKTPIYQILNDQINKTFPLEKRNEDDDLMELIGSRKSFVPELGQLLWQSLPDSLFDAYLYETDDNHRVAYVRIGNYIAYNPNAYMEEFLSLMNFFEKYSDALVIDQVNNPGGLVLYMYGLASSLTDYPLIPPRERSSITQEDVYVALQALNELEHVKNEEDAKDLFAADTVLGFPVDYSFVQGLTRYFEFVVNEWNAGHQLTDLGYTLGVDVIRPNPKGYYSKPLLILVNELDFSCGDFFPAILQDNGRATIFGSKTAGAGGSIKTTSHPNLFGISEYSFTSSIAERDNREPIENLGVQPDIEYEVTLDDMCHGYRGYKDAVNQAVKSLVSP